MDRSTDNSANLSERPLRLRRRPDLVVRRQFYQGREYWVVKDPVALKYYRLEEEEYALMEWMDGESSLDRIKRRFDRRFAPQKITVQEVHQFVGTLYRTSLVLSDAADQGRRLKRRGERTRHRQRTSSLTNILSIRLRGFDPDRLLSWLNNRVGWFFSLPAFIVCALLAASALLLVTVQFDVFRSRLPSFHEFFALQNWLLLGATVAATKVLHEFGHGLSCKRFGGECHEMGVMFLVLTPCLYCNVSDSWMLPSKWRRAAIGAAGMYVEIVLASVCTFLWWFSQPGMLHYICLNVMFVCSVTTLLFNANPLLRYDGYYILSDLAEIPNLRQKAGAIIRRKLGLLLLGLPEPHDPFLPHRRQWVFALYAVASSIYRWVVVLSIFFFLYKVLEPYGLKIIGQLIAGMALYGLLIQPLWQLAKFFRIPGRIERVKKVRLIGSVVAVFGLLAAIALIPLPHYVTCTLHVQPRGATGVYVDVPGSLRDVHVVPGQQVTGDQEIVTLESLDAQLAIVKLQGMLAEEAAHLVNLEQLAAIGDETAALELQQVEESLAAFEKQLQHRHDQLRRLTVRAPVAGSIFPPPALPTSTDDTDRLSQWSGTPLELRNRGAYLSDGVLVCQVGNPRQLEAVLAIDQSEIEFVAEEQAVEILLDQMPGRSIVSKIQRVSPVEMRFSPRSLSSKSGGDLATTTDSSGRERPAETTYQASAPLDDPNGILLIGATGQARIRVGSQTVGQRLWRLACRTFNFEL